MFPFGESSVLLLGDNAFDRSSGRGLSFRQGERVVLDADKKSVFLRRITVHFRNFQELKKKSKVKLKLVEEKRGKELAQVTAERILFFLLIFRR